MASRLPTEMKGLPSSVYVEEDKNRMAANNTAVIKP